MENFVDVRLSAEEAELIDFALDLVVDAYGKNLEQGGIVDQLKEKYRGTEARAFVDQPPQTLLHRHGSRLNVQIKSTKKHSEIRIDH